LGLEGKHLIGMQGPFSKEMNTAMIRQIQAAWMVTKESGTSGGFLEKYLAAKETECGLVVIGRPKEEEGISLEACLELL
ncbi:precorrin-6A/cobalt-precorrin-6A reductase, partial [Acinetobacter soli]|uniref:precorrin-6A/cobalt-precorrin-6A reductase n=1 Tax=Acinetobacter soli TaxID=487316 RepID=UPI002812F5B2